MWWECAFWITIWESCSSWFQTEKRHRGNTIQRNKLFKSIVTFKIKYQFGIKPTFLGHEAGSFGEKLNQENIKAFYSTVFGENAITGLTSKNQFQNTMGLMTMHQHRVSSYGVWWTVGHCWELFVRHYQRFQKRSQCASPGFKWNQWSHHYSL